MPKSRLLFTLLVLHCAVALSFGVNYPVYDLAALCDQTITVPCPYVTGRGGTLQLLRRPEQDCSVEIKLPDNCGHCGNENANNYAFYFNVRNFTKYPADSVSFRTIEENPAIKTLTGSVTPTNNPPSVAQYKTAFSRPPVRFIDYQLKTNQTSPPVITDPTEVVIDFVVIEREESENNVDCYELDAYVHRDLICDTTDNRINCPLSYSGVSGFNPAFDRQCSDPLPPLPNAFNGTYQIFDIEKRCNEVITIPCPTETTGRAGRLQFNYLPTSTCEVTVQLGSNCTSSTFDSFAIYLNMKQVNVFPGESFLIYETVSDNRTLRQEHKYGLNDTAVYSKAQFLTAYGDEPRIHLVYNRTSAVCLPGYKIAVDYTVLHGTSVPSSFSTYCSTLDGFVHNNLLCTEISDRINCPNWYRPNSMFGNPAYGVQCAEERTLYHDLYLKYLQPTLTIPCPTATDGRVGSLWASQNETSFRVNFTLPSGCGGDNDTFALYFNIRSLLLSERNALTIYKQYPGEVTMRIEKQFVGPVDQIAELSVAQYRSPFEKQPFVTFEFGGGLNNDFFVIDYAVYSKMNNTGSSFCPILDGYIKEDLLCDTDGSDDRINCPSSYTASPALNPATARYCTKPRTTIRPTTTSRSTSGSTTTSRSTTRTTTRSTAGTRSTTGRTTTRTTTRTTRSTTRSISTTGNWWDITTRRPVIPTTTSGYYWRPSTTDPWYYYPTAGYAPSLSAGAIAGIVIGVLAGLAILIAVLVLMCRRSPAHLKVQPPVSYTTNPNAHAPVVVGHAPQATAPYYTPNQPFPYPSHSAPYLAGQAMPYPAGQSMPAPPSYAAVVQGAHPPHPDAHSQPRV